MRRRVVGTRNVLWIRCSDRLRSVASASKRGEDRACRRAPCGAARTLAARSGAGACDEVAVAEREGETLEDARELRYPESGEIADRSFWRSGSPGSEDDALGARPPSRGEPLLALGDQLAVREFLVLDVAAATNDRFYTSDVATSERAVRTASIDSSEERIAARLALVRRKCASSTLVACAPAWSTRIPARIAANHATTYSARFSVARTTASLRPKPRARSAFASRLIPVLARWYVR